MCEIHTWWLYGVVVQNTLFDSGGKCVAMVTAYYAKNLGGNAFHFQIKFGMYVHVEV